MLHDYANERVKSKTHFYFLYTFLNCSFLNCRPHPARAIAARQHKLLVSVFLLYLRVKLVSNHRWKTNSAPRSSSRTGWNIHAKANYRLLHKEHLQVHKSTKQCRRNGPKMYISCWSLCSYYLLNLKSHQCENKAFFKSHNSVWCALELQYFKKLCWTSVFIVSDLIHGTVLYLFGHF